MNQLPLFELFLLSRSAFNERKNFIWYQVRSVVIHALFHHGSDDSDFLVFKTSMNDFELTNVILIGLGLADCLPKRVTADMLESKFNFVISSLAYESISFTDS